MLSETTTDLRLMSIKSQRTATGILIILNTSTPLQKQYSLQPGPQVKAILQGQQYSKRKNQAIHKLLCSLRIQKILWEKRNGECP